MEPRLPVASSSPSVPPSPSAAPAASLPIPHPAHSRGAGRRQSGDEWEPPVGWPPLGQVTYLKEAVTTLLLLLTLPYVLFRLVTRPSSLVEDLGRKHTRP